MSDVVEGTVEGEEEQEARAEVQAPPVSPGAVTAPAPGGDLVRTQAAAVAVTGFAVGAVTAVALGRRRARKAAKRPTGRRGLEKGVVASRSFLVDVHLLGPRD